MQYGLLGIRADARGLHLRKYFWTVRLTGPKCVSCERVRVKCMCQVGPEREFGRKSGLQQGQIGRPKVRDTSGV